MPELCPALFKYFDEAPKTIHLQVRAAKAELEFDNWYSAHVGDLGPLLALLKGHESGVDRGGRTPMAPITGFRCVATRPKERRKRR